MRRPVDILRREIVRLEPQRIYLPLGIGGHVDHQLVRDAGLMLLGDARRWVMPGPDYTEQLAFYEDFPYAWWTDFGRLEDLPPGSFRALPPTTPGSSTWAGSRAASPSATG